MPDPNVMIGDTEVTGSLEITGDVVMNERADHLSTPAAGKGLLWSKNTTPSTLIYTDDAGNDVTLGAAGATFGPSTITGQTQVTPASGDFLIGTDASDGNALKKFDVGDLLSGGSGITELTGDVLAGPGSGAQAATIAAGVVDIAHLSATGTPGAGNFLRGDNTWATPAGSGTVTSVAVSGSDGIEVDSGSPVTSSGTIALGINAGTLRTHINVENGATADQTDSEIETAYNNQVSVVSQAEAEAGSATTVRRWTAQRVAQAIATLAPGVTLAGTPNYLTIAGQVITRALIDLTAHVTGRLPVANLVEFAQGTIAGRASGAGTGDLTALSATQVRTIINVEDGAQVNTVTASNTVTLSNKRITPRVGTTTSSATPTINTDNVDHYSLTAQAADITSMTTNLSGTPTDRQVLTISITGTAARAITWGASFENGPAALPSTTDTTKRLDVLLWWNATTSKWRCMAAGSTA